MNLFSLTPTLRKENCLFFKIVALLCLFSAVCIILVSIYLLINKNKNWLIILLGAISPLVNYYIFLLFNSMCEGSLK